MKDFQNFLKEHGLVPEKKRPYYLMWLAKFLEFTEKERDFSSPETIQLFLRQLGKNYDEGQVQQAKDAVRLFLYYRSRQNQNHDDSCKQCLREWDNVTQEMVKVLRLKHRSLRTEKTYLLWLRKFQRFAENKPPTKVDGSDVRDFMSYLAVDEKVSASTQNQAFSAILFLFRHILEKDIEDVSQAVRAYPKRRLPVVLSRQEVLRLFDHLKGVTLFMTQIIYGSGLRVMECLQLRVKDIDFERSSLVVCAGKNDKDRQTVLPESVKNDLQAHLEQVYKMYKKDLGDGIDGVWLPDALARKYPQAGKEWSWYWVFPSKSLSVDPRTRLIRRHHMHPTTLEKHIKLAAKKAGITKRVTVHTLRHSFATHLLETGYDIRTIQELLGHKSVQTTMIYTHVAGKNLCGVKSPLDGI